MLPLGFVLFATAETGSTATAGVMVAAFAVASALAPVRGRIVDRHGGAALALFACACSVGLVLLVVAATLDAPHAGARRAERAGGAGAAAAGPVHARRLGRVAARPDAASGPSRSTRRARRGR